MQADGSGTNYTYGNNYGDDINMIAGTTAMYQVSMIKCFTSLKKRLGKINRIPSLTESWLDISIIFTMLKVENKTKTILD